LLVFAVCSSNIQYIRLMSRKKKKSKLNRIEHTKRNKPKDNILIDTTYLTENEKKTRRKNDKFLEKKKKCAYLSSIDHIILSLVIYSLLSLIHFNDRIDYTNKPETCEKTDCTGK
jgi:archaellum biogenesis ATPase FlaH